MKKLLLIIPAVLVLAVAGTWFYANRQVRSLVDTRIDEFIASGDYQSLEYETVRLSLNGDIRMSNLHVVDVEGYEYILEDIHITDFDYRNEVPHHLDLTAEGLRFPEGIPEFGNSGNRALNAYLETVMAEDYLPVTLNYRYRYSPAEDAQMDSHFSIDLPGSFLMTTESVMRNVTLDSFGAPPRSAGNPVQYSMLLQDADIPEAAIAVQDLGIVDAMLAIQGEEYGMEAGEYQMQLLAQLQTVVLFTPQQLQPLVQRLLARVAEFLEGNRTLRVSITPEYGGNVQQLQSEILGAFTIGNFGRIEEVLNLTIETY